VAGTVIVSTLNRTVVNLIDNLTDSVVGFSGQCGGQPVANIWAGHRRYIDSVYAVQ